DAECFPHKRESLGCCKDVHPEQRSKFCCFAKQKFGRHKTDEGRAKTVLIYGASRGGFDSCRQYCSKAYLSRAQRSASLRARLVKPVEIRTCRRICKRIWHT